MAGRRVAQLEVQFNWVFILIAGAVIIAFFFSIVQKQRSISDQRLAFSILNEMDAITTGASIVEGAAQRLDLPRQGLDIACTDACTCSISVGAFTRDAGDKLIFAPSRLEGEDVLLWALDWQMPFRAANFLYATNARAKYFFVYEDSAGSQQLRALFEDRLPPLVNAEFVTPNDIDCADNPDCVQNENYASVKFIFLDIPPDFGNLQLHESFQDTDVSALHVSQGVLTFYERQNRRSTSFTPYRSYAAGDATLFGAVFAADPTMYECNVRKASQRLAYVSHVIEQRGEDLGADTALVERGCVYATGPLIGPLWSLAADQAKAITEAFQQLPTLADQLAANNEQLIRQSCPTWY